MPAPSPASVPNRDADARTALSLYAQEQVAGDVVPVLAPATPVCGNDDHDQTVAVARVSWPAGPYDPALACELCLHMLLDQALDEHLLVTVSVLTAREEGTT